MADAIYAGDAGYLKTCTKCGETKDAYGFPKAANRPDGFYPVCKPCKCEEAKEYREAHPERILERNRSYRSRNPQKVEGFRVQWREKNPDGDKVSKEKYRLNNTDKVRKSARAFMRRKRNTPQGRLECAIVDGVRRGIKGGSKAGRRTFDLLGYTAADLKAHLERQFLPGMTWENHGRWHIDHRVPLSSFAYETPDCPNFKAAWALTNLQPLWAKDNLQKHAKHLLLV